jgi:hypothetical protein
MFRKLTLLIALSGFVAACTYAQGLNTNASKDDWEEINFEYNSSVLSDGYPSLLRLADLLHQHSGYRVKVEGNTDNLGSPKYNEKLGLARATTVKDFLVKYGASANQIEVTTRGKADPKYTGYKGGYSKTDVARWMNRRVVITVADEQGRTVSAGGAGEAIRAMDQGRSPRDCCDDILKRLDKLDDIARMLQQLMDQNASLRKEVDDLKNKEAALEGKVSAPPIQPPAAPPAAPAGQSASNAPSSPSGRGQSPFTLLGVNAGADSQGNFTFTGKGRYFQPFADHFALQAQAEYLYYKTQREGELDFGIIDRIGNFQGGLFTSFKHINIADAPSGGTLAQAAFTGDYLFKLGRVGLFATHGFMNSAIIGTSNATFATGATNADGTPVMAVAPNIFVQRYLSIIDQYGASTTLGLWGNNYLEANLGYLKSAGNADRPGGTVRFVFPFKNHFAFTAEGSINQTLVGPGNDGRAVFGVQFGNFMRPKDYQGQTQAVPADIPEVRYEVLSRNLHVGTSPPVADAGPDQIGVPAGLITLNGSNSHDPNGEALTYQWVQESGLHVTLNTPTAAITTFTAAAGQSYAFRLTVTNTDNQSASAMVRVVTVKPQKVQILFFIADPITIQAGQSSTLTWKIQDATSATLSPNIGSVSAEGGSISVAPTSTTTYTLTAKNTGGSDTATVTVIVQQPKPQIVECTAIPMNITQGQSSRLYYNTLNANTVTITPNVGSVGTNGNVEVTPATTTNYTITAANTAGTATCNVSVQVTPGGAPRIERFSANPLNISAGATSTLVWQVEHATTVSISPAPGSVGLVGTQDVSPTQTTMYTLTATNSFGSVTANVTVNVNVAPTPPPLPVITSFTANPASSTVPGSAVVLTCLATGASRVVISGVGAVNSSGSLTVNPTTTSTYVCVAINSAGGQVSKNLTVPVGPASGGGTPPVVVVHGPGCTVSGALTICQTANRQVSLDLSGSSSPTGNNPLTFLTVSNNLSAAVLNATSSHPSVQLAELAGDYFFTVTVTDSMGNSTTVTVDLRLTNTSPQN